MGVYAKFHPVHFYCLLVIISRHQTCVFMFILQGTDKPCNTTITAGTVRNNMSLFTQILIHTRVHLIKNYFSVSQYAEGDNGNLNEHFNYSYMNKNVI